MDEMLPWGLSVAQTSVLCLGFVGILAAWLVLKNIFKIAATAVLMILAVLFGCLFLVLVGFYIVNAS
jgi:hypothetical protein